MKARQLILTVMVALIACNPVMAQNHIDKIVDELEQKGVDAKKVVKRDPKTKKPYYIVKSLTFYSKDSNYANRLKEAFKKDAEDAIEEKVEKKGNSYRLIFADGKKKTTYYLNIQERQDKDPRVDLRIYMKDGDVKGLDNFDSIMDFFGSDAIGIKSYQWSLDSIRDMMRNSDLTPGQIVTEFMNRGYTIDQIRQMREQVSKSKQKK
jgi:hypothetical protein